LHARLRGYNQGFFVYLAGLLFCIGGRAQPFADLMIPFAQFIDALKPPTGDRVYDINLLNQMYFDLLDKNDLYRSKLERSITGTGNNSICIHCSTLETSQGIS